MTTKYPKQKTLGMEKGLITYGVPEGTIVCGKETISTKC